MSSDSRIYCLGVYLKNRWRLFISLIIIVLMLTPMLLLEYSYANAITDLAAPNIAVSYRNPLFFEDPSFTIDFVNESNSKLNVCISAYGWYPNGSIIPMDHRCGRGSVDLDYKNIRIYAGEWRKHLEKLNNDVEGVKPGVIILGTAITEKGLYFFTSGIPIKSKTIEVGTKARTKILVPTGRKPDKTIEEINEEISRTIGKDIAKNITEYTFIKNAFTNKQHIIPTVHAQSDWPPSIIIEPGFGSILYWVLQDNPKPISGINVRIPIAMVYLSGSQIDKVDSISFLTIISAVKRNQIVFSIVFTGGASIIDLVKGTVSYSGNLWSITLSSTEQYLRQDVFFDPMFHNYASAVYGVGIIGDFVVGKYRLNYCTSWGYVFYCGPLNIYVDLFLVRPYVKDNKMEGWSEVDTTIDGNGLSGAFLWVRENYRCSNNVERNDYIRITSWDLVTGSQTTIRFSLGIDLIALLKLLGVSISPFTVLLAAMIGYSEGIEAVSIVDVLILLKSGYRYSSYYLRANYFINPQLYQLGGTYYRVPLLYLNVSTYQKSTY